MMRNSIQVVARVKSASDTGLPCFSTADQSLGIMEQSTAQCLVSLSVGRLAEEVRGTVGNLRLKAISSRKGQGLRRTPWKSRCLSLFRHSPR